MPNSPVPGSVAASPDKKALTDIGHNKLLFERKQIGPIVIAFLAIEANRSVRCRTDVGAPDVHIWIPYLETTFIGTGTLLCIH